MGNGHASELVGDEPINSSAVADRSLQHFDHNFKGELHTCFGPLTLGAFGECSFAKRPIEVVCKGNSFEITEDVGLTGRKKLDISYTQITGVSWDHSNSEVKLVISRAENDENFVILTLANSIEFEGELKLRFGSVSATNRGFRIPSPVYIGMFAGATKPKPFQRKRPNLSSLPSAKLPVLHEMRTSAIQLNKGCYKPCPSGESRRIEIAMQHIYEGHNTFGLLNVRGIPSVTSQWRSESVLVISDESMSFKPFGSSSNNCIEFAFEDIVSWKAVDNDNIRLGDSGIEITSKSGDTVLFGVAHVRDVKHTLEYFWNQYQVGHGGAVMLGSTHGRPLHTITTLSGDVTASESPTGQTEVVDQDGMLVRPGARMATRRGSVMTEAISSLTADSDKPAVVPSENREVRNHWHKVVVHQGWLLKKGGVGIGAAKSWIKRYFVLYRTSQGHFLTYYSDFTECPLFSTEKTQRNIVDLAKTTFIRPGSNKAEFTDTPPHSFDIVTTEREWTLCAESQENVHKWLKLLTRGVDEDVAILPDEELVFKVKPKVDPFGILPCTDYSTALKVGAFGVSVCSPDSNNSEREHYFWVYTDFYKWSLLSQAGKLALLVNVFADSSFSRRNEYIFRTKEAVRLATAIEYFIEKFMSVMHIRLETTPGAFDEVAEQTEAAPAGGMHQGGGFEEPTPELDLLGLEISTPTSAPPARPSQPPSNSGFSADPFGDTPFGSTAAPPPVPPKAAMADPFADDIFGSAPPALPPKPTNNFAADPFADDIFSAPAVPAQAAVKTAPALSPGQLAQHNMWYKAIAQSGSGPFYDDSILQIAVKLDVRASQCKVTLIYRNQGVAGVNDLIVTLSDRAGLVRYDMPPVPTSVVALSQFQQIVMMECMKPAAPGLELSISYVDALQGKRVLSLAFPVTVATFHEPLMQSGVEFVSRWQHLSGPGLESQEVFKPSQPIVIQQFHAGLTSALKFARVTGTGLPDESEFVIFGSGTLRTGATTPTGEKTSIGCLLKLEINVQANAVRVTVRTLHPTATVALMHTVKSLLG